MSTKITIALCLFVLLLPGSILAQKTDNVNLQANSGSANISSNSNRETSLNISSSIKNLKQTQQSCRFISLSEAEKMQGEKLEEASDQEDKDDKGLFSCFYTTPGAFARSVGYNYRVYSSSQIAKKAFKLQVEIDELAAIVYPTDLPLKTQPVNGIGEAALISYYKDSQSIFVKKGSANFTVSVDRIDAESLQKLKKAAIKIAKNF